MVKCYKKGGEQLMFLISMLPNILFMFAVLFFGVSFCIIPFILLYKGVKYVYEKTQVYLH